MTDNRESIPDADEGSIAHSHGRLDPVPAQSTAGGMDPLHPQLSSAEWRTAHPVVVALQLLQTIEGRAARAAVPRAREGLRPRIARALGCTLRPSPGIDVDVEGQPPGAVGEMILALEQRYADAGVRGITDDATVENNERLVKQILEEDPFDDRIPDPEKNAMRYLALSLLGSVIHPEFLRKQADTTMNSASYRAVHAMVHHAIRCCTTLIDAPILASDRVVLHRLRERLIRLQRDTEELAPNDIRFDHSYRGPGADFHTIRTFGIE
ncbi:MAG: hypothetical protein AAB544_04660 [Patescibacteria group bacterium]